MTERNVNNGEFRAIPSNSIVDNYRIVRLIARCDTEEVYRAFDLDQNRTVAIKFLNYVQIHESDVKRRFELEATALSSSDHISIIDVYKTGEHEGRAYIVTEYIEGETLENIILAGRLSANEAIGITIQLCEALSESHRKGIVHGRIKAANIMISSDGVLKLGDFGLRSFSDDDMFSKPGSLFELMSYMSPEQIKGESADPRSDVFSVGVLLYEMLAGRHPFKRDDNGSMIQAILTEDPETLKSSSEHLPSEIDTILRKSLAKSQEMRYRSIDEMRSALKKLPPIAKSDYREKTPVERDSAARKPWLLIVSAAVVIAALVASLTYPWNDGPILPSQMFVSILPFATANATQADGLDSVGLLEAVTDGLRQLERFRDTMWVVPAAEVLEQNVTNPTDARNAFGVTTVVTCSLYVNESTIQLNIDLFEAKSERLLRSEDINLPYSELASIENVVVKHLAEMLDLELEPTDLSDVSSKGTANREAYEYYLKGLGYLTRRLEGAPVDSALKYLELAVESDSTYPQAYAELGEAYWRRGSRSSELSAYSDSALQCVERAVRFDEDSPMTLRARAVVYAGLGKYDKAIADYRKVIDLNPEDHSARVGLGDLYWALGNLDSAEAIYRTAVSVKPLYWNGNLELGRLLASQGKIEEATKIAEKVRSLPPVGYHAWNNLGALYYGVSDLESARICFEQSRSIQRNYSAASNLGTYYYIEKEYEKSVEFYSEALEFNDADYTIWGNLATAQAQIEHLKSASKLTFEEAIKRVEDHLKFNDRDPYAFAALAEYQSDIDEMLPALTSIRTAQKIAPDDLDVILSTATVYVNLDWLDSATVWLDSAAVLGFPMKMLASLPDFEFYFDDSRNNNR